MSDETQRLGATPIGIALVLLGSASMAMVPTAAKLALNDGASLLTVITVRGFIGAAVMAVMLVGLGQGFRARRVVLLLCLFSGLCYTAMSYGFIGAVAYIPVSLMLLIFFLHPIIVAVVHHYRGETTLSFSKVMLIFAVFVGLGFALGPDLSSLDPLGIALALLAAASVSGMIFLNARAQKEATSTLITFYMTMVTVGIFGLATIATADWMFPVTPVGWAGLMGTGLGLGFGLLSYFAAFRFIGPVRASVISTVEPLMGILFAVAVLGEALGLWQWVGVFVVIMALVFFELPERRK
ncbi:MAG: DMT family transporter [Hyphomicrobiales bacterium]|nr:DMT family transporter [Hyphomicrobiales bacterium]MCP4998515.1 DMT family transporter [Hyphomicrobiales bacterium]